MGYMALAHKLTTLKDSLGWDLESNHVEGGDADEVVIDWQVVDMALRDFGHKPLVFTPDDGPCSYHLAHSLRLVPA